MRYFLTLAALAASAFAQNVKIGAPADMSTITPGTNITVRVDRPNTLTGSTEVGIAIGLWPCPGDAGCAAQNTSDILGTVAYVGGYDPQYSDDAALPPHQNFSITVPPAFESGQVSLGVAHFSLVGAGASPYYEYLNVTLVIP